MKPLLNALLIALGVSFPVLLGVALADAMTGDNTFQLLIGALK